MTEAEWRVSTDTLSMLAQPNLHLSKRKIRLHACAWARSLWPRLEERSRTAVEIAERVADGLEPQNALVEAYRMATDAWRDIPEYQGSRRAMRQTTRAQAVARRAANYAQRAVDPDLNQLGIQVLGVGSPKITAFLADVLRDLLGVTPFRQIPWDRAWLRSNNGAVLGLATTIYDEGRWDHLPVLADALEDAGCDNADILGHLRSPGPHVRGCWAVDLLLGRS